MATFTAPPGTPGTLVASGELDIYAAREAYTGLAAWLQRPDAARIDLSAVERLDTSGLQVLAWAHATSLRRSRPISLEQAPPAVRQAFADFGLEALLAGPGGSPR